MIPPLCIKFSETRNFQKYQKVHLRNYSVLWGKEFSTKILIPPSIKFFDNGILRITRGAPRRTFSMTRLFCDNSPCCLPKSSPRQLGSARYFHKHQIFSEIPNGPPRYFFGTVILWGKKFSTSFLWSPSMVYQNFRTRQMGSVFIRFDTFLNWG